MNYVFGPVPSRRLGQSLGIDTIPLKTCNWNCVYCQLGRTQPLTSQRQVFYPVLEILEEVKQALAAHSPGSIDWVTFVGSGEPTLHAKMGELIRMVKVITQLPVAVITNGSLLYLPEVRQELAAADAVLPTLDAGNALLYRKINRPHPKFTFSRLVEGLVSFRCEYTGKLWVEVMLVKGLNDTPAELWEIAGILQKISPDAVHINLPSRPPVETWVQPPSDESLLQAMAIFGKVASVVHPAQGSFDLSGFENPVDAMVAIISRHPVQQQDLEMALNRWPAIQVQDALEEMRSSGKARMIERYGIIYWVPASAHYPEPAQSARTIPQSRHKP